MGDSIARAEIDGSGRLDSQGSQEDMALLRRTIASDRVGGRERIYINQWVAQLEHYRNNLAIQDSLVVQEVVHAA